MCFFLIFVDSIFYILKLIFILHHSSGYKRRCYSPVLNAAEKKIKKASLSEIQLFGIEPIIDDRFEKNLVLDKENEERTGNNEYMVEQIDKNDSVENLVSDTIDQNAKGTQNGTGRNLEGAAGTSNAGKDRTKNHSEENAAAQIRDNKSLITRDNEKLPHRKRKSHKKKEKKDKKSKKSPEDDDNSDDECVSNFLEVQDKRKYDFLVCGR